MTPRPQYVAAWIALLSMLMTVVAPLVSQARMAAGALPALAEAYHPTWAAFESAAWSAASDSGEAVRGATRQAGNALPDGREGDGYPGHHDDNGHLAHHGGTGLSSPHDGDGHPSDRDDDGHPGHHDGDDHSLAACGYCFFFTSSPTVPGGAVAVLPLPSAPQAASGYAAAPRWLGRSAYLPHHPRAPPAALAVRFS